MLKNYLKRKLKESRLKASAVKNTPMSYKRARFLRAALYYRAKFQQVNI